jgi:HlyD family secretion protein
VARRDDVLRAPAAATRFRPTAELLEALGAAPAKGSVLWQVTGESITPVPVKTGLSDGTWTELIEAPLEVGTQVVTRAAVGTAQGTTPPARTNSPLMGTQPGRR